MISARYLHLPDWERPNLVVSAKTFDGVAQSAIMSQTSVGGTPQRGAIRRSEITTAGAHKLLHTPGLQLPAGTTEKQARALARHARLTVTCFEQSADAEPGRQHLRRKSRAWVASSSNRHPAGPQTVWAGTHSPAADSTLFGSGRRHTQQKHFPIWRVFSSRFRKRFSALRLKLWSPAGSPRAMW